MSNTTYNIVFSGTIAKGRTAEEVKKNLSMLFKKDAADIELFFTGDPVVIKKQVDQPTAEKYKAVFLKAGAICDILPAEPVLKVPNRQAQIPIKSESAGLSSSSKGQRACETEPLSPSASNGPAVDAGADAADAHFKTAESLFKKDSKNPEAFAELDKCLQVNPDHWEAHYAYASHLLLAVDAPNQPPAKARALYHAQKAFELTGYTEFKVLDILSNLLAENGKKDEGINLLEKAYGAENDDGKKKIIEKSIDSFRAKNKLGRLWQFFDANGKIFFETIYAKLITERLINGAIPPDSLCLKNRVGTPQSIKDLLAKTEPSVEIMMEPVMFHIKYGAAIGGGITGCGTGLYYLGKFLIYYLGALPGAFADWIKLGLQNIVAFVAAIIFLGVPSLALGLILLGIVIAVIGGATGILGAIPGLFAGGLIGGIVGVIRAPFIPKIGSKATHINNK